MGFAVVSLPPLLVAIGLTLVCGAWLQGLRWVNSRNLHLM
jgi:hypothetical protein